MTDPKQTFAERLKIAMVAAGYKARPSVLEREFNSRYWGKPMTLHGVRRWLLGETMPRNDKIIVLADWLGLPPESLGFGASDAADRTTDRPRWSQDITHHDRELLEAMSNLPVAQRKLVREVIMTFARDAQRSAEGMQSAPMSSPGRTRPDRNRT